MSALPPKADIGTQSRDVRFVPKADICSAANFSLFDHLVGGGEQGLRHGETKRFGRFEIDHQLVLSWRLHRQVGRLLTSKNAINIIRRVAILVNPIRPIRNKASLGHDVAVTVDRGQLVPRRKLDDQFSMNR